MSDTPETDAFITSQDYSPTGHQWRNFTRKLERERNEALMDRANGDIATMTINHYERILRERDELRDKYDTLATEHMLVVNKLCKERDDARDALSRIDEIFCDGEDTHDDWMKMGSIAKDYFKGLE